MSDSLVFSNPASPSDYLRDKLRFASNPSVDSICYIAKFEVTAQLSLGLESEVQVSQIKDNLHQLVCHHNFQGVVNDLHDVRLHLEKSMYPNYDAIKSINAVIGRMAG